MQPSLMEFAPVLRTSSLTTQGNASPAQFQVAKSVKLQFTAKYALTRVSTLLKESAKRALQQPRD